MDRSLTIPLDLSPAPAHGSRPLAFLHVETDGEVQVFPLTAGESKVGRVGSAVAVPLPGTTVSRAHALLECLSNGTCFVEDLKSANRTYLANPGAAFAELCPGRRYQVLDGGRLRFGAVTAVLRAESAAPAPQPQSTAVDPTQLVDPDSEGDATEDPGRGDRASTPVLVNPVDKTVVDDDDVSTVMDEAEKIEPLPTSPEEEADLPFVAKRGSQLSGGGLNDQTTYEGPASPSTTDEVSPPPTRQRSSRKNTQDICGSSVSPTIPNSPLTEDTAPPPEGDAPEVNLTVRTLFTGGDTPQPKKEEEEKKPASESEAAAPAAPADSSPAALRQSSRASRRQASATAADDPASSSSSTAVDSGAPKRALRSTDPSPAKKPKPSPKASSSRGSRAAVLAANDPAAPVQWFFKRDLRLRDANKGAWHPYTRAEADLLEAAYKADATSLKLSEKYTVDFKTMIQYRNDDEYKQRPVKRVP